MRVRHAILATLVAMSLWAAGVCQGQTLSAPPRPAIPPSITYPVDLDSDLDHVDDAITARVTEIRAEAAAEPDAQRRAAILQRLQEPVEVEMLFAEPITDADLAAFVNAGGTVDHVFSYVSYGWGGKLPLITATQIAPLMGQSFLAVLMSRPVHHMIDEATRTGRVRPVWAPGFAGSTSGFTGSPTTSIAIIDMGLDGTHTDLAGRMRWWKDWVNSTPTPVDYDGHGTLAAAVALGTGAAAGVNPPTLSITASGDASSLGTGIFLSGAPASPCNVGHDEPYCALAWRGKGDPRRMLRRRRLVQLYDYRFDGYRHVSAVEDR